MVQMNERRVGAPEQAERNESYMNLVIDLLGYNTTRKGVRNGISLEKQAEGRETIKALFQNPEKKEGLIAGFESAIATLPPRYSQLLDYLYGLHGEQKPHSEIRKMKGFSTSSAVSAKKGRAFTMLQGQERQELYAKFLPPEYRPPVI